MLEAVLNMSGDMSPALPPLRAASVSGSVLEMKFWNVLQAKERKKTIQTCSRNSTSVQLFGKVLNLIASGSSLRACNPSRSVLTP